MEIKNLSFQLPYMWHSQKVMLNMERKVISEKQSTLFEVALCDKSSPGEMQHTSLLTLDREPITDQVRLPLKSIWVNQCLFLGLLPGI